MRFLEIHPECQIRERHFIKLKPYYIRALKDRNVCCYWYHVELDMLWESLNNLQHLKTGLHSHANCQYNYRVCIDIDYDNDNYKALTKTYKGMIALWEDVACSKNWDKFVAQVQLPHGAMQQLWSFQTSFLSTIGITYW